MKPTRDDILVLLRGIWHYADDGWTFVDLEEDERREDFSSLQDFDKSKDNAHGIISWLEDCRDIFEEVQWSIDIVLEYLREIEKSI